MKFKSVIIFTLGAATGGLVATLFWREKYRQKYQKQADEKVESMLDYVNRIRERSEGSKARTKYEIKNENEVNSPKDKDKVRVTYHDIYTGSVTNRAEDKLAESEYPREEAEESGESGDERSERTERMKDTKGEKPKIIKAVDFENQYTWFDKCTLLYYTEDGVLANADDGEPVDDVERFVGDALDKFGFRNNDEEVIFVRNFSRGSDYEIAKVFGAWADS